MRDCETLSEDLKAYQDGELPLSSRLAVRLHLARCASCREEISAMENIGKAFARDDAGGLSPEMRARLVAAIPPDLPQTTSPELARTSRKVNRPLLLWGATASALLLWFVCYPLTQSVREKSADSSATMQAPVAAAGAPAASTATSAMANAPVTLPRTEQPQTKALYPPTGMIGEAEAKSSLQERRREMQVSAPAKSPDLNYSLSTTEADKYRDKSAGASFGGGRSENERNNGILSTGGKGGQDKEVYKKEDTPVTRQTILLPKRNPRAYAKTPFPAMPYANGASVLTGELARQVRREADITVEVDNAEAKGQTIEDMVKIESGYVASNQLNTLDDGTRYATLSVKVPVAQFDTFLNKIARLGIVKAKNVSGEDLTEKISDSKQAVKVLTTDLRATQQRLDHPRNRAQSKMDAETLRELRIKHVQQKARLEMMTRMATLSTIGINLTEKPKHTPPSSAPAAKTGGFLNDLRETAQTAGQAFVQAAKLPVLLLIWIFVYSPLWLILLLAYRKFVRG